MSNSIRDKSSGSACASDILSFVFSFSLEKKLVYSDLWNFFSLFTAYIFYIPLIFNQPCLTDFFVCCTSDKRFASFAKKSVKLSCFFQLRNGVVRVLFCPRLVALFFHIYLFSHGFVVIHRDLNVHKLGWNKYDVVNFC